MAKAEEMEIFVGEKVTMMCQSGFIHLNDDGAAKSVQLTCANRGPSPVLVHENGMPVTDCTTGNLSIVRIMLSFIIINQFRIVKNQNY